MRVNWESLYRQRLILTVLVARNLEGPAVVVLGGLFFSALDMVSILLAVT